MATSQISLQHIAVQEGFISEFIKIAQDKAQKETHNPYPGAIDYDPKTGGPVPFKELAKKILKYTAVSTAGLVAGRAMAPFIGKGVRKLIAPTFLKLPMDTQMKVLNTMVEGLGIGAALALHETVKQRQKYYEP